MTSKLSAHPDYKNEKALCIEFLTQFQSHADNDDDSQRKFAYLQQLQLIVDRRSQSLTINLDDIHAYYHSRHPELVANIELNTLRYVRLFYKCADKVLKSMEPSASANIEIDAQDVYTMQREARFKYLHNNDAIPNYDSDDEESYLRNGVNAQELKAQSLPAELVRRYEIHISPASHGKIATMRDIRAKDIGSLKTVRGIVTRVTDVAPLIRVVVYICTECGFESYQSINDKQFTPLRSCPSSVCKTNQSKGHLIMQNRASKYVKYEAVKLQELPSEVPVGHIPRTINLRVYGEWTRKCKPGDSVTITGVFLPTPYTGFRAIRAGLTADTYIELTHLVPAKQQYNEIALTPALISQFDTLASQPNLFDVLSSSIAPEIYGHSDIKKSLLLLLISGVTKTLNDGVKIRGDLNILLMGDPGVAKSQLLKQVATIAPRGVYTTGKGSSGVGLTAAVIRDPVTGSMSLEGGSLVLADKGVCCIDEFDKMEESDRTSIHEVMEQQTVSIAKAGITTTLNARTSVVAAANPVFGRFNPNKSIETNLGLPTSLLSRFDLAFIILDRPDRENDEALATHVTHVHRHGMHPDSNGDADSESEDRVVHDSQFLRSYISYARTFEPVIPPSLLDDIVSHYAALRSEDENDTGSQSQSSKANSRQRFVTPRSLLSILRLAQAHARLHLRSEVVSEDISAAIGLMNASKYSVNKDNNGGNDAQTQRRLDPISSIYGRVLQEFRSRRSTTIDRVEMKRLILAQGFTEVEYEQCLQEYERLNVWGMTSKQIHLFDTAAMSQEQDNEHADAGGRAAAIAE